VLECAQHLEVFTGIKHAAALADGELYVWGELICPGYEKDQILKIPKKLNFKETIISVACGFDHTIVLTNKREVFGMGKN
jgi:alpha-tubulin suppressor-like RCC1 family protein